MTTISNDLSLDTFRVGNNFRQSDKAATGTYFVGTTVATDSADGLVKSIANISSSNFNASSVVGRVTRQQTIATEGNNLEYESGLFIYTNGDGFSDLDRNQKAYFDDDTVAYKLNASEARILGGEFKGFVTGSNQGTCIIDVGNVNSNINSKRNYEFYEHSGSQTASGSLVFTPLAINGTNDSLLFGLSTWDTSSFVFQPAEINRTYTLRMEGEMAPIAGDPVFRVDFAVSGASPNSVALGHFRHHQSVDVLVRNVAGAHQHVHAVFEVFADADLFASGGQLYIASDGPEITLLSASLMIKNGAS